MGDRPTGSGCGCVGLVLVVCVLLLLINPYVWAGVLSALEMVR